MLDTNVIVSALLIGGGTADMAVQLVVQGAVTILADSRILAEYDEVTARPRFGFAEAERRVFVDALAALGEPVAARPLRVALPDEDDRISVEVALAGAADAIVTGKVRHFVPRRGALGVAVWTQREFVDHMRH